MNDRIIKLAQESFFDEATNAASDKMYTFSEAKMQKFAELIVQECVGVSLESSHRNNDMGAIIAREIEKHFGIEKS